MNPALSDWLDRCRVLAAITVFAGHLQSLGWFGAPHTGALWRAAHDAVVVFFVLSGLLIAHVTSTHYRDWRGYAIARTARIYSVAVPVVLFTWLLDSIALHFGQPVLGTANSYPVWQYAKAPLHALLGWGFAGELWRNSLVPFSLAPYWSLSYEVWYYALFGVAVYAAPKWRAPGVAVLLLAMGYKLWLLLPIWLLGVWLYRRLPIAGAGDRASARAAPLAIGAALLGYFAWTASGAQQYADRLGWAAAATLVDVADARNLLRNSKFFVSDYVVALLVALLLTGLAWQARQTVTRWHRAVKMCADYSFTFYLLHYPILMALGAFGWGPGRDGGSAPLTPVFDVLVAIGIVIATTVLLGALTERRRWAWRDLFDRILSRRST